MIGDLKTLQQIREETPELVQPGDWLLINVEPKMAWPNRSQLINFEGHDVWLLPITENAHPGLAVRNSKLDRDQTIAMLYRLLSVIAWYKDDGATVSSHGGGRPLFPIYGKSSSIPTILPDTFDFTGMPPVVDDTAKLALALMREGRGLNHPAYSFLAFYRVLECALPSGKERGAWMSDAVERVSGQRAMEALDELQGTFKGDVAMHLRESGRGAVAHAAGDPVANPDEPADYQRLTRERPIIEELASMAIEEVLGVQTSQTISSEHLYELSGWRNLFLPELTESIRQNRKPRADITIDLPEITISLRRSDRFEPLGNLKSVGWDIRDAKAILKYRSQDGRVTVTLLLDFVNERLVLPLQNGIQFRDDGSAEAAQVGKALTKFNQDYYANGELQVWKVEDDSLMSRCSAFIPVNVMFNPDGAKAELDAWNREIVRRAFKEASSLKHE